MSYSVITPVPMIIAGLRDEIFGLYPDAKFVFDPTLEYVESFSNIRSFRNEKSLATSENLPLFSFNRKAMVNPEYFITGKRHFFSHIKNGDGESGSPFKFTPFQFELIFKIYAADPIWIDTFEAMFINENSINGIKEFSVTLPEVGEVSFFVKWSDFINDIGYSKADQLALTLDVSANIYGYMILMNNVSVPILKVLNFYIDTYLGKELVAYSRVDQSIYPDLGSSLGGSSTVRIESTIFPNSGISESISDSILFGDQNSLINL